jgi:hypothetical protein
MPTASDASMDFLVSLKKNQSHKIVVSVNHNDLLDIKLIKLNKSACTFDVQACAWDVAIAELDQAIQNVYESGGKQNV